MSNERAQNTPGQGPRPDPDPGAGAPDALAADEPVPRLPRGRGLRLSGAEIMRIVMFGAILVGVLMLRQPCADGVSGFIEQFDEIDAGPPPAPEPPVMPRDGYIRLTGDMSEEEILQRLTQGSADAPGADGQGSADAPGADGQGSADAPGADGQGSADAPGADGQGSADAPGADGAPARTP